MIKTFQIHNDFAERWAYTFQDPASDSLFAIIDMHDRIIFYVQILLVVVLWFLISGFYNKDHLANLHHGNLIELIWTITPAVILWIVGLPSLKLLYIMDLILNITIELNIL